MKKLISLLMCVLMLVPTFTIKGDAAVTMSEMEAQKIVDFAKEFGFFTELTAEDAVKPSPITRAQLATVISRVIGMEGMSGSEMPFTDVPDWAKDQVSLMYSMGIMVGDGEGQFMPSSPVTGAQAAKILVHVLGYDLQASSLGGYPHGYMLEADKLDLFEGINVNYNEAISRFEVACMLYNAVWVEMYKAVSYGDSTIFEPDGKDYLETYLETECGEGVLWAIYGKSAAKDVRADIGYAVVDGRTVKVDGNKYDSMLGYRVKYFIRNSENEGTLVLLTESEKNSVKRIKRNELLTDSSDFTLTNIVYENEGQKSKSISVNSELCYAYNGKYDFDFEKDDFDFATGYVDIIDHDLDEIADVVLVWDFENIAVSSVSGEKILGIYNNRLDLGALQEKYVDIIFPNGERKGSEAISEINSMDVVSVAKSRDGEIITAVVCTNGISGTVEAIDEEGIWITGKSYRISEGYNEFATKKIAKEVAPGFTGEFYFDVTGEIAATTEKASANELKYGFLLDIGESGKMSGKMEMLILTNMGSQKVYVTTDKIKFTHKDGATQRDSAKDLMNGSDLCPSGTFVPQIIQYRYNEEEQVTEIVCPGTSGVLMYDQDRFTLDHEDSEGLIFKVYSKALGPADPAKQYYPQFRIGGGSTVFFVPMKDGEPDLEKCRVVDASYFEDNETYEGMKFYDNDETLVSKAIVYQPDTTDYSERFTRPDDLVLIEKVYMAENEDGDWTTHIQGYMSGGKFNSEIINTDNTPLGFGDIVYAKYDMDGKLYVDSASVLRRNDGEAPLYYKKNHSGGGMWVEVWSTDAIVYRRSGNNLSLYCGGDTIPYAYTLNRAPIIYIINTENKEIRLGKPSDILASSAYLESDGTLVGEYDGSRVFLNNRFDYAREAYVFE